MANNQRRKVWVPSTLLYVEGLTEKMFLKHLVSMYHSRHKSPISIRDGRGGSATHLVMKAGEISPRYDRTVVILDGDDEGIGEARKEAAERNLVLIENNPCMEGLFLTLLGVNISGRKSGYCKDKFESRYMAKREKRDLNKYKEVFPKNLLDHKRKELEKLNEMISYVEGEDSPSICEGA